MITRGKARTGRMPALVAALTVLPLFCPPPAACQEAGGADDECLKCHSEPELAANMEGGAVLSLYVDAGEFALSPHRSLGCAGCHQDKNLESHPEGGAIPGRGEDPARWSAKCRTCHSGEDELTPVHQALLAGPSPPPCSPCHPHHRMRRVREWKPMVSITIYCLLCHQKAIKVSLDSGETLSLTIRDAAAGASVHLDHRCTDCHEGFSKLEHPVGAVRGGGDQRQAGYQLCRPCHEELYEFFEGSVHFKMLTYGHPDAPVCTDCHGYHAISPKKSLELLSGVPCRRCHLEVFESFRKSVHGADPRAAAHTDVPLCVNCHRAHDVTFASVRETLNESCLGCHEGAEARHAKWLPETALHFGAVACSACHTPAARREFVVRIYDSEEKSYVDISSIVASREAELAERAREEGLGSKKLDFWGMVVASLNGEAGGQKDRYSLRLEIPDGVRAHEIGGWKDAQWRCSDCHSGDLEYLGRVFPMVRVREPASRP